MMDAQINNWSTHFSFSIPQPNAPPESWKGMDKSPATRSRSNQQIGDAHREDREGQQHGHDEHLNQRAAAADPPRRGLDSALEEFEQVRPARRVAFKAEDCGRHPDEHREIEEAYNNREIGTGAVNRKGEGTHQRAVSENHEGAGSFRH